MKQIQQKDKPFNVSPTFGTELDNRSFQSRPNYENGGQPKSKIKRLVKRVVLSVVALIVIGVVGFGWDLYSAVSSLTGQRNPFTLISTIFPRPLAETNGRINILIAGYSVGDPHHQGASLTDSIMIASINPKNKTGVLVSVPRDLWVNIPGNGYSKINAAYEYGQRDNFSKPGYFPGGMGLLEEVVSKDFGVNFNYYALINYAALKDAVNAVGGITITIHSTNPKGIYDAYTHLKLPNGRVTLNGQEALNLARARGDNAAGDVSYGLSGSDFERTQHQQQMLVALKDKASQMSSLINPITVIRLVKSVGSNVITNLDVGQMETMYSDTKGISNKNIKEVTINNYNGQDLLSNYSTYQQGYFQEALVPAAGYQDFSAIRQAVHQLMYQ